MPRLHFLDGLRGWAAVVVLLYHVFCDGLPVSSFPSSVARLFLPFNAMYAVFVFFLVSGFALATPYLVSGDPRTLIKIGAGRYLRLAIPIFGVSLLVHVANAAGMIASPEARMPPFGQVFAIDPTWFYLLRFSLVDVFFAYSAAGSYAGPLWTMSIELAGSALILALLACSRPDRLRLPVLAAASIGLLFVDSPLALFAIGGMVADAWGRGWLTRMPSWGAGSLIGIGGLAPFILPWQSNYLTMVGAAAFTLGCITLPALRTFLSTPFSRWLGVISFPLYLIHGPVMMIVGAPLMASLGNEIPVGIGIQVITIAISVVAAWMFVPINSLAVVVSRAVGERASRRVMGEPADRPGGKSACHPVPEQSLALNPATPHQGR